MIKVFVASSDELKDERDELTIPVLGLNGWLYSRGEEERVALEKWEYLDSSMGEDHKQEMYNRALRACDMAVGLCWRKFGQYTEMEVVVAQEEIVAGKRMKRLEIWFKEAGDVEVSAELDSFRKRMMLEGGSNVRCFASMKELRGLFTVMVLKELARRGIKPPDDAERDEFRLELVCEKKEAGR